MRSNWSWNASSLSMQFDILKIERLLQHRLQSVETLIWAQQLRSDWNSLSPISVLIDGRLTIEGTLSAITNPMLEAGFIHARALLEFLGLCDRHGKLGQITHRNKTDVGIEYFENADGPLRMLRPELALSRYEGPRHEAEKAFLRIFQIANKGLAHTTSVPQNSADDDVFVEIACRGIPALMTSYFYTPRGMFPPNPAITTRPHPNT